MRQIKVLRWLVRFLLLDKTSRLLSRIWPTSLRPATWLPSIRALPIVARFLACRSRQSPLVRHILGNLAVGFCIAILVWWFHGLGWLREAEDNGIDWVMKMQWGTQPARSATPYALIDIDEETYRTWGEPFHLPRDRLLKLIEHAVQGRAAAIVVDVDLSQPGYDPKADEELRNYLAHYDVAGRPPLILARVFRDPLKPEDSPYRSLRKSFLEETKHIAQSTRVYWGSPLFKLDQDRVLRRWRLWDVVCTNGQPDIVPSIQLLTVAALLRPKEQGISQVAPALRDLLTMYPPQCQGRSQDGRTRHDDDPSKTIEIAGMKLYSDPDTLAQRIVYVLSWRLTSGLAYPEIARDGTSVPILSIRSALTIVERNVDASWLGGRVAVIGGSFAENRDRHATPLGEMPGSLVLINAVHSLQEYGELSPPPFYAKIIVECILIVVMSVAFALFDSFWGMLLSGAFIILALLPVSFLCFRSGVWLDFAIPLVAVQLHQMAKEFEESRNRRGGGTES